MTHPEFNLNKIGGLGYVTENCVIDTTHARSILADLKERKDLV